MLLIIAPTEAASSSMRLCRLAAATASLEPSRVSLRVPTAARNSGHLRAQLGQLLRGNFQPREQHAAVLQDRLALRIQVHKRGHDQEIHARQRYQQQNQRPKLAAAAGRQCCERDYGATSALIVNSSEPSASSRVTGAANPGFRNVPSAASGPINRAAAADRPLRVTFRCRSSISVR